MWAEGVGDFRSLVGFFDGLPGLCVEELRRLSDNRALCNRPLLSIAPPPGGPQLKPDLYEVSSFVKAIVGVSCKILAGFLSPNQEVAATSHPQLSGFTRIQLKFRNVRYLLIFAPIMFAFRIGKDSLCWSGLIGPASLRSYALTCPGCANHHS